MGDLDSRSELHYVYISGTNFGIMKLEEYFERVRNCPDDKLNKRFGIYDNFPILLNFDYDEMLRYFKESDRYKFTSKMDDEIVKGKAINFFRYLLRPVKLQLRSSGWDMLLTGLGKWNLNLTEEERIHSERQLKDYGIGVMLHSPRMRDLAFVAEEISQFAISRKIPLCISQSQGEDILDPERNTEVIYYP